MAAIKQRGSYKVRDSTDGPPIPRNVIRAYVTLLEDNQFYMIDLPRKSMGQDLIDRVNEKLDLVERDYFGLQYSDDYNLMQWVEGIKPLRKQVSKREKHTPMRYYFRVKFYTPDPSTLTEELTRYQYFLQVRQDLSRGHLQPSAATIGVLGAYIIQSEVDDYDEATCTEGYVSEFRMFPDQTEEDEARIQEHHQQMVGLKPSDCERYFLERCQRLPMYGVELHAAMDSTETDLELGVSCSGLSVYQRKERINNFPWASMSRMTFKKRMFFIHQRAIEETLGMPQTIGFRMPTYRAAKKLWKSCVASHTFFRHRVEEPPKQQGGLFRVGSRYRYSGRTHFQTMEFARRSARFEQNVSRKPSMRVKRRVMSEGSLMHSQKAQREGRQRKPDLTPLPGAGLLQKGENEMDSAVKEPFTGLDPKEDYDEANKDENSDLYPPACLTEDGRYVLIRMEADSAGRFGFNVKGGSDQNQPVTVSRINPDTPAAKTSPQLHTNDEIIKINETDVSAFIHDQVVQQIRASREASPPVLILTVKPAANFVRRREEDAISAVQDLKRKSTTMVGADGGPEEYLRISIEQLQEGLTNDSVLSHFDQLYRRNANMSLSDGFIPENYCRNRYRDIAPYNATRVKINAQGRDYINSSYVKTKAGSRTLDYIAAQGPLPHTLDDFWQMIWEQKCQLIVMVTAEEEAGRTKCECYWPRDAQQSIQVWDLEVTLLQEQKRPGFSMFRVMTVLNTQTKESRQVTQLQYLNWPDHGEPEDSGDFIKFVLECNKQRLTGQDLLVHCSAGVGRTGMFICMETALAMMVNKEPIYPLEIVQSIRDQRPMVIQTSQQYEFVCHAIIKAFKERLYTTVAVPGGGHTTFTVTTSAALPQVAASSLTAVEEVDGKPAANKTAAAASSKAKGKPKKVVSESESDSDSDSSGSSSSDDDDDDDEGGERIDDIRLNPLAMFDD